MPNAPQPPRRSWRDDASGVRAGTNKREWQKEPGGTSRGPRFSKRLKILVAVVALLSVVGGVVALWWHYRRPDEPEIVLIGAGYETNLAVPHNVYGKRGLADVKDWVLQHNASHGGNADGPIHVHQEDLKSEGDPFATAIKKCRSKNVVVYVAVHGGVSVSRGAYLIPNNANPRDGTSPYTIDKALTALEQLPKDTNKLLLLDTTQVDVDWNLGLLHNDFVRTLANDPRVKNMPNLIVLCASDENQRSWVSEEYGRTIFAHFVVQGLKGAAKQNDSGLLTAHELIEYVQQQVESWVRHNRGAVQTPRLIDANNAAQTMNLGPVERLTEDKTKSVEVPVFTLPAELIAAWKQRDELAISFPHPATYTPHLWREYHEALLRYEQLLRAGDGDDSRTMEQELAKLVNRIRQSQRLEYDAMSASLSTPAALGWSLSEKDGDKLRREFDALWSRGGKPEEFGQMLKDWQATVSETWVRQLGRVRVAALLFERARGTEADFQRVCAILKSRSVEDELLPRPAETHFALMLTNVPERGRDWARLRASLTTRLHAEQAALGLPRVEADTRFPDSFTTYSEQIMPWIRKEVEDADKNRRLREDLLFASPTDKKAVELGKKLSDADAQYGKVQERAAEVRAALELRDRVLADLPYYSQWLAGQPLSEDDEKRWLETWDAVHQLCHLLDDPRPENIDALKESMKKIHLDELAQRFKAACELNDKSVTQQNLRRLLDLLTVPLIAADIRKDLLNDVARISRELNLGTATAEKLPGVDKQESDRLARTVAQRQGRFALHMLGKDHPDYKVIEPIVSKPEGDWQKSLARAGEQLGDTFTRNAVELYKDTDKGHRAPLDEAAPLLRDAALRVRLTSGAAVAAWPTLDPVGENRNLRMHELMKWQGERTFADYWASEIPGAKPYYRTAGNVYAAAAESLAGNDSPDLNAAEKMARLANLTALQANLAAVDTLAIHWRDGDRYQPGPSVLNITDEDRVPRGYGLVCSPTTPDGYPVVWPEIGKSLRLANPDDLERRALDRIPKKPEDSRVEISLIPERPPTPTFAKEKTRCALQGFYRGRRFGVETAVALHNLPEIEAFNPQMPPAGRIAIVASKEDYDLFAAANSELVIVVDYSGSMVSDNKGKDKRRIDRALDALEACLRKVPKGVKVTVLTFSHKGRKEDIEPQWEKVRWDPSREAVTKRMAILRNLEPDGWTPLAYSTVKALDHFTPGFSGAKTLVILTDGGDNSYKNDAVTLGTKGLTMAQCLQKFFAKGDVALTVVGFELSQMENADEKKGLKDYTEAIETINGVFLPVEKTAELAETLEKQLLQIRFFIDEKGGRLPINKPIPKTGFDLSAQLGGTHRWIGPLKPGLFNVVIQTNRLKREALTQLVDVRAGESIVLRLVPTEDKTGFNLRRETYVESFTIKSLNRELYRQDVPRTDVVDKTWIMSVLQNQAIANINTIDGAQIMVALEEHDKNPIPHDASLGMTRPHFVWFRAAVPNAPKTSVPGLRFYPLADYPAPCYRLDYLHWPSGETPVVDVWWNDRPLPEGALVVRPVDKPLTLTAERPVEVRPANQTERTTVVIESITAERRAVVLQPGDTATKEVECLVVRLRYPVDGQPFFVQLPPGTNVGAEHRFYTEAGKYTGIFWNVSDATAKELKSLTIYSVAGVLNEAHHVGPLQLKLPDDKPAPEKPKD